MKRLFTSIFMAVFLVGCTSGTPDELFKCSIGDSDKSSIVTFALNNDKIKSTELESSLSFKYLGLNGPSEQEVDEAIETLKDKFGSSLTVEVNKESLSLKVTLGNDAQELLKELNIPYDDSLVKASDFESLTSLFEKEGGSCSINK